MFLAISVSKRPMRFSAFDSYYHRYITRFAFSHHFIFSNLNYQIILKVKMGLQKGRDRFVLIVKHLGKGVCENTKYTTF